MIMSLFYNFKSTLLYLTAHLTPATTFFWYQLYAVCHPWPFPILKQSEQLDRLIFYIIIVYPAAHSVSNLSVHLKLLNKILKYV